MRAQRNDAMIRMAEGSLQQGDWRRAWRICQPGLRMGVQGKKISEKPAGDTGAGKYIIAHRGH